MSMPLMLMCCTSISHYSGCCCLFVVVDDDDDARNYAAQYAFLPCRLTDWLSLLHRCSALAMPFQYILLPSLCGMNCNFLRSSISATNSCCLSFANSIFPSQIFAVPFISTHTIWYLLLATFLYVCVNCWFSHHRTPHITMPYVAYGRRTCQLVGATSFPNRNF